MAKKTTKSSQNRDLDHTFLDCTAEEKGFQKNYEDNNKNEKEQLS